MNIYKVIGLMSGTSLDGLDLTYCHFTKTLDRWDYKIVKTRSVAYSKKMEAQLKDSISLSADQLLIFNNNYGEWLGKEVKSFIADNHLKVDFIASHGHTTHHQPENGLTYQIGSGQHLANTCGYKVICDFRTNDVALGGQGAPLVPIGDRLLFGEYDFCLNLGGISNISFEKNGQRIAYDIGLANMVLNHITLKIDLKYDKGGALAQSGKINEKMLKALNTLEYYRLPYPKSTGYEWFMEKVVPIVAATDDRIENLLHTCIHHLCEQIAIQVHNTKSPSESSLFVTGGGALNDFLIATLREKLGKEVKVVVPSGELIENKEALIFALMGVLRMEREINVLSSVTGAIRDSSCGVLYWPN
ncbi:anhydro-N-acetylmuramic acid kinase [Maribacter polysaccharolyticus]|uniref:anhydro-N-acetylmuramic acid kinase n=1 Tax=Maribacter polysaccharolyticus TaxID=3020831 RepID=UPI00237F9077|nr:anhydro-N-acetylmuramic acid kinase [Maribacter polysaccharolyticus]MDE3743563.1 anhydro-N-acetylmuramic acid kinase [Maribacter polysaccharolyticus]